MLSRGRRLKAEYDGLGRGDDILGHDCEALVENIEVWNAGV